MKKTIFNSSLWEGKPTKLSILVPTRDMVHAQFSYCLAQLKYNFIKSKRIVN